MKIGVSKFGDYVIQIVGIMDSTLNYINMYDNIFKIQVNPSVKAESKSGHSSRRYGGGSTMITITKKGGKVTGGSIGKIRMSAGFAKKVASLS